jgi:hypothetical protein
VHPDRSSSTILTLVRYVHYPEEQDPFSLTQLSRVGTSCQFRYDFMELKGAAIKYLGADTGPYAEIIGTSYINTSVPW